MTTPTRTTQTILTLARWLGDDNPLATIVTKVEADELSAELVLMSGEQDDALTEIWVAHRTIPDTGKVSIVEHPTRPGCLLLLTSGRLPSTPHAFGRLRIAATAWIWGSVRDRAEYVFGQIAAPSECGSWFLTTEQFKLALTLMRECDADA